MIISNKKLDKIIHAERKKAIIELTDKIREFHIEHYKNQKAIEESFNFEKLKSIDLNVWDEISNEETTYAYIESNGVPDKVCFEILSHFYAYISKSPLSHVCSVSLRYFDITNQYPENLLLDCGIKLAYKRWELYFESVNHENLNLIIEALKQVPAFNEKEIVIFSES